MSRASARAGIGIVAGLVFILLLLPVGAQANQYGYVLKEEFGPAAKPIFGEPVSLATDSATGDLLVADLGANEQQQIVFNNFADGDKFTLTWTPPEGTAKTTSQIAFSTSASTRQANVKAALEAKFGLGNFGVEGPFNTTGPVTVNFKGTYAEATQSLMSCAVASGSGSCTVERTRTGAPHGLFRFKPNGEPDSFSALGSNLIDGKGGADKTPQEGLAISNHIQIATDSSCALHQPSLTGSECTSFDRANGNIYVTQEESKLVDVFSSAGEYLGQLTEALSDEIQKLELSGFAEGDEFTLSGLPGSCGESHTAKIPYTAAMSEALLTALEGACGESFTVRGNPSLRIEFTGAFGDADQSQLNCTGTLGILCSFSTTTAGAPAANEVQRFEIGEPREGGRFALVNLPATCGGESHSTGNITYHAATIARNVREALEAACGPNFAVSLYPSTSATIEFTNTLGAADQPQLSCAVEAGSGSCIAPTVEQGGLEKPFGRVSAVAVDPEGAVYVGDGGKKQIHKYLATSNFPYEAESLADFGLNGVGSLAAGAGTTAGYVFASSGTNGSLFKLDSSTGEREYTVGPGGETIALDSADGTLVSAGSSEVAQYDASGPTEATRLARFSPPGGAHGLAVDPTAGNLYLARAGQARVAVYERVHLPEATTEPATGIGGEDAILRGKVSAAGGPAASCEFQYLTEASFNAKEFREAKTTPCSPLGPFTGSGVEAVSAHVEGLAPGTSYRFRVVAKNAAGTAPEGAFFNGNPAGTEGALAFKTLGPALGEFGASEIAETEATISAQIDPNGEATTFAVEYVTLAEYGKSGFNHAIVEPSPPEGIGSEDEFVQASYRLTDLIPGTAYRYRVVATNTATARSADRAFATYPLTAEGLPDGRAYEKVTPSHKKGEPIPPEPNGTLSDVFGNPIHSDGIPGGNQPTLPMQASPDGKAVLYSGQPFAEGLAPGQNSYLSRRSSSGWDWRSLSPLKQTGVWVATSEDLTRGVVAQVEPALSPQAPTRGGEAFANLYLRGEGEALVPLVEIEPPHRDPGNDGSDANRFQVGFAAANAGAAAVGALTHVVFEANDALTPATATAPAAPAVTPNGEECASSPCDLYEWVGGQLRLVNVKPGNAQALGGAVIGSGQLLETIKNYETSAVDNAVSADGRTIFFSSEETGQTYARIDGARTLEVPGPGTCKASVSLASRVCFLTASADGHQVLLSNGHLYGLNETETAYEPQADLTEGTGSFEGSLGASESLSRIYFADPKALPGAEPNAQGEEAAEQAGEVNLYYWHEGSIRFISQLLGSDNQFFGQSTFGDWRAPQSTRTAQATPDGHYLTFMSTASLTGYDNACQRLNPNSKIIETIACREVFEYNAQSGGLSCASCNSTGNSPLGPSNLSRLTPGVSGAPDFRQPLNLPTEGEGRLFFESRDTLSIDDRNGHVPDVYEWEPDGVGSCDSESDEGGCVYLISSGTSPNDSLFLDSTPSGNDAFFITRSRLVPSDKDEQLDLYDARVGGGIAEEEAPAPCEGEGCKGPSTIAPQRATMGTSSFAGPGNPKAAPTKLHKRNKHKRKKRHRRAAHRNRGGRR